MSVRTSRTVQIGESISECQKLRGITPMTVWGRSSIQKTRPMASVRPSKSCCQARALRIAGAGPFGAAADVENPTPADGTTPSTENSSGETARSRNVSVRSAVRTVWSPRDAAAAIVEPRSSLHFR